MYQDPDENNVLLNTSSKKSNQNTPVSTTSLRNIVAQSSNEIESAKANVSLNNDDDDFLPLDPSILSKNLGIPIIVIVTKVN